MPVLQPHALETRKILAGNVRQIRRERRMTQEALADAAGYDQAHISEIETGKRNIALDGLSALAHALAVPVGRLFQEG